MAENFILPPNQKLDAIVNTAADGKYGAYEEMRERLKMAVQSEQASTVPADAPPPTEWKYEKQIRWAESTGKRPVTIRAMSQEDLDALERQVLYGH